MADIWFISDTHFFHDNILKFEHEGNRIRPMFDNVGQMNEMIAERWNASVKHGDKVYHLGDVTFKYNETFAALMKSLHGRKRLVVGNHDEIKNKFLYNSFEKIQLWRLFKDEGFMCSHIPLRVDQLRHVQVNVHGHIHQNLMAEGNYINVCVEHTNYMPINMDSIKTKVRELSHLSQRFNCR